MTDTITGVNFDLLKNLIAWAEADEQALTDGRFVGWGKWDQGNWGVADALNPKQILNGACQTAYCMAGQAVAQSGFRLYYKDEDVNPEEFSEYDNGIKGWSTHLCIAIQPTDRKDNRGNTIYEDVPDARPRYIEEQARVLLGLTSHEANTLFEGDNSIDTLKEIANAISVYRGGERIYPEFGLSDQIDADDYED